MAYSSIAAIRASPLDLPLTEPFAIATGATVVARNILVEVQLSDGSIGLGEAAPFPEVSGETQESGLAGFAAAREAVVGCSVCIGDTLDLESVASLHALASRLASVLPGEPALRCGVEMAVVDAVSRSAGTPLWRYFGARGATLTTDMTITAMGRDHARDSARRISGFGFFCIKVKVGAGCWQDDLERLRDIHGAAPDAELIIDANGGFGVADAGALVESILSADIPVTLFEQPVPREDWRGFASLVRGSAIPVAADESAGSVADVERLLELDCAPVVNIKLMKAGVSEAQAVWRLCRDRGLRLMIGGMVESILAMTFSAHFAAGLGGFDFVDLDTPLFVAQHPFQGGFDQVGERLDVSHVEAGHGVSLS